jgi:hypothetical protein
MILTDKEKLVITEFIHAYQTDTLIKSEGEAVIELFKNKGVDTSNVELEVYSIRNLIRKNIGSSEISVIVNDYLNGKLA